MNPLRVQLPFLQGDWNGLPASERRARSGAVLLGPDLSRCTYASRGGPVVAHLMICAECTTPFTASRIDAETCGHICRNRRARRVAKVRASRTAAEVETAAALLSALAGVLPLRVSAPEVHNPPRS